MPWTLWRYTLVELWRLVLLSAAVLVGVIAFAAAVKPLADGALTPLAAVRFMLLAVPPMLAYALPFAASFGATLAYYRMAQDNEVIAALAGGVSHRVLLVPALASGVVLALVLAGLNEQVIPRFLSAMERMVTQDLAQVLVRQIDRGQPVRQDNLEVYADSVHRLPVDPGSGIVARLELLGVVIVELDRLGRVQSDATAERARIDLEPGLAYGFEESSLACVISIINGTGFTENRWYSAGRFNLGAVRVPDTFGDDPKYLTRGELEALRERPEAMDFVRDRCRKLARLIAATQAAVSIERSLREGGAATLTGVGDVSVEVRGGGLEMQPGGWVVVPAEGQPRVVVEVIRRLESGRRDIDLIQAETATLRVEGRGGLGELVETGPGTDRLTFLLDLDGVMIRGPGGGTVRDIERPTLQHPGLELRDDPMTAYTSLPPATLIERARALAAEAPADEASTLNGLAADLEQRIARLMREVTSKGHERVAMAINCLVMVMTGALTALALRHSLPLVVYLWSFFPALLTVLLISSGQQHAHGESLPLGLTMLWSGVAALAVYAGVMLARISRH